MTSQKSISNRLQEFALAQIDGALTYLTAAKHDPDEAIHETRRCLKRVRAGLRLLHPQLADATYDRDNVYLRNIGRRLATLRDAAVMTETLAGLKKQFGPQLSGSVWREIKQEFSAVQR